MNVLWYWPHPQRTENALVVGSIGDGDRATVLCLASFQGEELATSSTRYEVRRVLPDVAHGRLPRGRRVLDRVRVLAARVVARHRAASRERFDVVHVETVTPFLDALALPLLRRRAAIVLTVHDVVPHEARVVPVLERAALRVAYRAADRIVVFHDSIARRLTDELGIDRSAIAVVPHPIAELHPPTDVGSEPPTALFFGSFRSNKGLETLLAAIDELRDAPLSFVIAGSGPPDVEQRVRTAASSAPNLEAEIGFADVETKARVFGAATIVVLPYTADFGSQSGVLLDAYAHGLPSVVTDVGAIGPTVHDDGTGWVVPPDQPHALATALRTAAVDGDERRRVVARVLVARERYRADVVGGRLADVHRDALAARRR